MDNEVNLCYTNALNLFSIPDSNPSGEVRSTEVEIKESKEGGQACAYKISMLA